MDILWNQKLESSTPAYQLASSNARYIYALAGPGTGKSFALKRRIARLLEEGGCQPSEILLLTFTRTSVRDWQAGIDDIGLKGKRVPGMNEIHLLTFHDYCLALAKRCRLLSDIDRSARILSAFEEDVMLNDLDTRYGTIPQKRKLLLAWGANNVKSPLDCPGNIDDEDMFSFGRDVKQWLYEHKAMAWGELPREVFNYLQQNPYSSELSRYKHILVDEYQDLTLCEQNVIDLLGQKSFLTVVGDDDQSIYEFRHAYPEGMRLFLENHAGCDEIRFPQCRRSPHMVVELANTLIKHNSNRSLDRMEIFPGMQTGDVQIIQAETADVEIRAVAARIIRDLDQKKISPQDVLVLTSARSAGERLFELLRQQKEYPVISFFRETAANSDLARYSLSIISLLANPKDMVSLRYALGSKPLLGTPSDSFKSKSYQVVREFARNNRMSIQNALRLLSLHKIMLPKKVNASIIHKLLEAYGLIQLQIAKLQRIAKHNKDELLEALGGSLPKEQVFRDLLAKAIALPNIDFDKNPTKSWKTIHSFLVNAIYFPQYQNNEDSIRIMSLHGSKGLSALYTVIVNVTDTNIPRIHRNSSVPVELQMECERRLFYVAITRCKGKTTGEYPGTLIISSHINRVDDVANRASASAQRASRFISELGPLAPKPLFLKEADIGKEW